MDKLIDRLRNHGSCFLYGADFADTCVEAAAAIETLLAERDAAIRDLNLACALLPTGVQCQYCKHDPCSDNMSDECDEFSQWEWRGI